MTAFDDWTTGTVSGSEQTAGAAPWGDWGESGGGNTSPLPVAVRCPITFDAAAAQVRLPEKVKAGTSFVAHTAIDAATTAQLPTARYTVRVDDETVVVQLTGSGGTVTGPEYESASWPGGKPKPRPVPDGTPYVTVLVVAPPGQGQ